MSPPSQRRGPGRDGSRRVLAGVLPLVVGLLVGWVLPRGPVTTTQAVLTLVATLLTGVAAGWLLATAWAVLYAPIAFAAAFELARWRTEGPTVDGVALGDVYGVLAFVSGRGVDALLMLLPLVVGVGWGLALLRRRQRRSEPTLGRHRLRGVVLALSTAAVVVLAAALLRPASTAEITGPDGDRVPGSVAELVDVPIGGHDQTILLRGRSEDSPVLLFLEGGPGGTALGRIRNSGTDLEKDFVVATWDQRGTGKSYDQLEPRSSLTVEQMVADTLQVTDYLRERFDEQKIYLVGSSWGTTLGVLAAQRSPERFHAFVGTGQMVDQFETDKLMYAESLADARARGDDDQVDALLKAGEPPYDDTLDYLVALSSNPTWTDFEHGEDYSPAAEYPASLFAGEYTLVEQLRGMAAIAETFDVLYPQLRDTDFRRDVPRLQVPVYVVEGRHEASGRSTPAREWFEMLRAPRKQWVLFERSGHTPPYDEPGHFAELMRRVSAETGS